MRVGASGLDPSVLREIVEQYAEGDFNRLFDRQWGDWRSFYSAACDYVGSEDERDRLRWELMEEFGPNPA